MLIEPNKTPGGGPLTALSKGFAEICGGRDMRRERFRNSRGCFAI